MSENFADDLIPGQDEGPVEEVEVELTDIPEDDTDILPDEVREINPFTLDAGPGEQPGDFRPKADYGTSVPKDFSVRVSAS